jgi:methylated-DNA-[protein]-cysteine S-methyltransferase
MQYTNKYHSPLGDITMASNGEALTGLWFDRQKYFGGTLLAENEERDLPIFEQARRWLDIYFCGENPDFTPPLSLDVSPFRLAVWEILKTIQYGHVMTYGNIAKIIAKQMGLKRMSAQAVGGAVGHNSVSIIIPCHRVVGSNGSLTGYAGGIDKKIKLLALEKAEYIKQRGSIK